MARVIIDDVSIHRPEADCEISESASLIEIQELSDLEMKALPEEICGDCFPELAERGPAGRSRATEGGNDR